MGLDKREPRVFTKNMPMLPQRGLGNLITYILRTLGWGKKVRMSPFDNERHHYEAGVRKQFEELKKKGLSIPVFTL